MDKIMEEIKKVRHPEINMSLFDLGMIGKVDKNGNKVSVELKLPNLGVPIKYLLENLIINCLKGYDVSVSLSEMSDSEKQKFFKLAKENWALY